MFSISRTFGARRRLRCASGVRAASRRTAASQSSKNEESVVTLLKSVAAAGGLLSVVFGLASKNLAEELVGGMALKLHGHVEEGDEVKLGDGTAGIVQRMGWISTEICGYDDLVVDIPNSRLLHERSSNVTHSLRSQVKQVVRFHYSDLDKVPIVLDQIKQEVKRSCPKLVSDGSAVYRATITKLEADHVEATVNLHFDIAPMTDADANNRQQVLLAIARALKQNDVEFALPSCIEYRAMLRKRSWGG